MKKLIDFLKDNQGVALIEFAFILPIIFLLTFPMIDYARYVLLQQKVIKTAYVIGDAITMSRPVEPNTTQADITQDGTYLTQTLLDDPSGPDLMDSIPQLMLPFREAPGTNKWQVVVSHVRYQLNGAGPEVTWQYDEDNRSFDANNRTASVGVVSGFNNALPATLPTELLNIMQPNEDIIVVEVRATHEPITPILTALGIPFLSQKDMFYTSYLRTRYGNLQYMWSNNCPPTSVNCP